MFSKQELKQHLLGVLEIAIFMRVGAERFKSDFNMMVRSFLWPAYILPFAVVTSSLVEGEQSIILLIVLNFLRIALTFILSIGLIFLIAKKIDRTQHVYRYITASNWFEIAMFILMLPILMILYLGGNVESIQNYAIFVTCLGIIYNGFILTHTLRIPWELATLIAVSILFIQETGFSVLEFVKDGMQTI